MKLKMLEINANSQYGHCAPGQQTAISQAKGLLNMPGQNNCFLNSAVQVLWHLDHFRNAIDLFSGHYCTSATTACVFCSLSHLFGQLKNSTRNALNADQLRRALAHTFSAQRRFQLGLMDDCIECFEHILQRLHFHCVHTQIAEEECNAFHCLSHALFAMKIIERRFCTHCGKCEARTPYNQYVQYVSTPALIERAASYNNGNQQKIKLSFGSMVRLVSTQGEIRDCSVASCGSRVQLRKTLLNAPKVLAIGLNYENERPSIDQIADVFKLIDTFIRLSDVFEIDAQNLTLNSGEANCDVMHLVGLVTYYGKHYSCFFYNTQLQTWLFLDDANVKEIGNCWPFVVDKCIKASFQPLMLLYASANNSNSINTNLAPQAIYQVPNSTLNNRNRSSNVNPTSTKSSFINKLNSLNRQPPNGDAPPPDSPFAKSSTASSAYFSDYYPPGQEPEPQYISKRAVQSIIQAQAYQNNGSNHQSSTNQAGHLKNHFPAAGQQRNSSSSLSDSYSTTTDQADEQTVSAEGFSNGKLYPQAPVVPIKPVLFRKELRSADAGYDSYSLSSSDSYPSIGGSAVSTTVGSTSSGCSSSSSNDRTGSTTNKSTLRSIQEQINEQSTENLITSQNNSVLADSQLLELINDNGDKNGTQDSDKLINRLCSQSDILLLRSHEKERENDLKAAAVLSEAAAQKARAAMDVPIQNPNSHSLISAKMKHSICVMRSAALIRQIKELEQEEKKAKNLMRLSRESLNHHSTTGHQINHTKSHSTSHLLPSHHQRRASQERLIDEQQLRLNKQQQQQLKSKPKAAVQLYGTLPKKHGLVKSNSSVDSLPISVQHSQIQPPIKPIERQNSAPNAQQQHHHPQQFQAPPQVKPPVQPKSQLPPPPPMHNTAKAAPPVQISPPNQIPVNLSEQVVTKVKAKQNAKLNRNASTCSTSSIQSGQSITSSKPDAESGSVTDQYAEIGDVQPAPESNPKISSKQHKIRKKLLIGSFIKRKNRSLPDLREGQDGKENANQLANQQSDNGKSVDEVDCPAPANQPADTLVKAAEASPKKAIPLSTPDKQIAKVSRKGFHPQSIYENQKQLLNLSQKLNQAVVLPKLAPKPAINKKPTNESVTEQQENKKLELKQLDLPPVNCAGQTAVMQAGASIDEVDLANLPPPPEHFLVDLRKEKEQANNQINENLDNEARERKLNALNENGRSTAVRNLATRFEQIGLTAPLALQGKPPLPSRVIKNEEIIKNSNQMIYNQGPPPVVSQGGSQVGHLIQNGVPIQNPNGSPQSQSNGQQSNQSPNKFSSMNSKTGLRVAVLGARGQSPTLIYKNSTSSAGDLKTRPDKPPDYDTTIKRLNLMQQQQAYQPNKSIDSNYSLVSLPSSLNSSLDSPFKNGSSQNGNLPLPAHQIMQLKQQQYNVAAAVRGKKITKKSVSFSDEVVIVAHPEDTEEAPLPNPLLDRVLKKNNLSIS